LLVAAGQLFTLWHWRPLSDYWYSLCWYGVALTADALVGRRHRSLLDARRADALWMLVVSALAWWALELGNRSLQSWSYSPSTDVPLWLQRLRATVAFASLVPATFELTMLALLFPPLSRLRARRAVKLPAPATLLVAAAGIGSLAAAVALPALGLPLVLGGVVALGDPLNHRRGRPSLLGCLERGDWRLPLALCGSAIAAGFVGEMWNYPADPRWTYHVPWIDCLRVFEMPLIGYLGYGLLALAVFVAYHALRLPRSGSSGLGMRFERDAEPLALVGLD
jgi:hypothetical protein